MWGVAHSCRVGVVVGLVPSLQWCPHLCSLLSLSFLRTFSSCCRRRASRSLLQQGVGWGSEGAGLRAPHHMSHANELGTHFLPTSFFRNSFTSFLVFVTGQTNRPHVNHGLTTT